MRITRQACLTVALAAGLIGLLWLVLATRVTAPETCARLLDEAQQSGEAAAYAHAEAQCGPIM